MFPAFKSQKEYDEAIENVFNAIPKNKRFIFGVFVARWAQTIKEQYKQKGE